MIPDFLEEASFTSAFPLLQNDIGFTLFNVNDDDGEKSLRNQIEECLLTYFRPHSHKELNLPEDLVDEIEDNLTKTLHPTVFKRAYLHILSLLRWSLGKYVQHEASKNINKNLAIIIFVISIFCAGSVIAATLLGMRYGIYRVWRLLLIPFIFLASLSYIISTLELCPYRMLRRIRDRKPYAHNPCQCCFTVVEQQPSPKTIRHKVSSRELYGYQKRVFALMWVLTLGVSLVFFLVVIALPERF